MVQALGLAPASSVPTTTATIRSAAATPLETLVYVATVEEAATHAG